MRNCTLLAAALIGCVLASSCSVKETRRGCPSYVTIMSDGEIHKGHKGDVGVRIFLDQMDLTIYSRASVSLDEFIDGTFNTAVPRGWFFTSVLGGTVENCVVEKDTLLRVPYGCQCDSLCASWHEDFTTEVDDFYTVRMPLEKQFCNLTMRVLEYNPGGNSSVRVKGRWNGFSLLSMEPHAGVFQYDPTKNAKGYYSVRLPRQGDNSLSLELWTGSTPGSMEGYLLYTVPLGELIERTGYSWGTASLDDIYLEIDYFSASISIVVGDWEDGNRFDMSL